MTKTMQVKAAALTKEIAITVAEIVIASQEMKRQTKRVILTTLQLSKAMTKRLTKLVRNVVRTTANLVISSALVVAK